MVLEKVKKVLDKNALLMSGMGLLFTYLSFMNKPDIIEEGWDTQTMIWQGIVLLFIVYGAEISKPLLLEEKITKKLEFLLSNGVSFLKILVENTLSLFISVELILLPAMVLICSNIQSIHLFDAFELIVTMIGYSLLINLWILNTKNLNKIKTLSIQLVGLTVLIQLLSSGVCLMNNGRIEAVYIRSISLVLLLVISGKRLSKESIVTSYY